MDLKDTKLFFLEEDCKKQFGEDKGEEIFQSAGRHYEKLCCQADFRNNAEIEYHKKKFPQEGWDTQWIRCDGKEIHFDMTRCIYKDICDTEDCPELCAVFCENDDIAFSGLMPKIRFTRKVTSGKGADRCDFHFVKNK